MKSKKWKNKNFWVALLHSLNGIKNAFLIEKNMKIQCVFAVFAIVIGFLVDLTEIEWILLCLTIGIVLFAELVNTSIEKVLDVYSEKYDEQIKLAKDVASGAVLITAIMSGVVGAILFLPKII